MDLGFRWYDGFSIEENFPLPRVISSELERLTLVPARLSGASLSHTNRGWNEEITIEVSVIMDAFCASKPPA